jgi:phospholipid/cholesterol/gamma-HCH transport system substrate-binding protein
MMSRDLKVGVFVLGSLLALGAVIFLIGSESNLFSPHAKIRTSFHDVQGLARGSPVRMGGVDIGRVEDVGYGPDKKSDLIVVQMTVLSSHLDRIRADSIASLEGRGLLGDKMIVITVGSPEAPEHPKSELIKSKEAQDLMAIMGDIRAVAHGAEKVVQNLEKTTNALAQESLHNDVQTAVADIRHILESVKNGEGYIGKLVSDPAEAKNLSETVAGLKRSAGELELLLRSTRSVIDQAKTGPGLVHEVFYGKESERAVAQFGGAAEELGLALRGIREGNSFAHSVLYEDKSAEMVQHLTQASSDLSAVMKNVKEGRGTVGALLSDPSVYEDLKVLLGNVGRNRSLRALVRYSIRKDEEAGRVSEDPPEAPPATEVSGAASGSAESPSATAGQ